MWDRRARVTATHDGDTLIVVLDQGFGDTKSIHLRLLNTFAPELAEKGGPDTRSFVQHWLDRHDPDGDEWPYIVTTERVKTGHELMTFSRYVGTLTDKAGESLNEAVEAFVKEHGYGGGTGSK
jgi:hypothetical protein